MLRKERREKNPGGDWKMGFTGWKKQAETWVPCRLLAYITGGSQKGDNICHNKGNWDPLGDGFSTGSK